MPSADQSSESLASAIRRLAPRHTQLLRWRFLEEQSLESCAALLGIPVESARIHLVRALDELDATLAGRQPELRSDDEEEHLARELESSSSTSTARRLKQLGAALEENAVPIRAAIRQAELAEEVSPDRVREDWIRRIAVLILIGLAAYFYWRNEAKETPPRPTPTDVPHR